jgi:hypothetical protein
MIKLKNYPDTRKGFGAVSNNRPTLHSLHPSYQTASRGMRERFGQKLIPSYMNGFGID